MCTTNKKEDKMEQDNKEFIELIKKFADKIFEIGYAAGESGVKIDIAKAMYSAMMEIIITAAIKDAEKATKGCKK